MPGGLFVDPAQNLGPISPLVYGSNYGPWIAVPADMLDAVPEVGVTILRFPGGAWGDQNDVKTYQLDQIMGFAKLMNAQVSISVRLKGGSPDQAVGMMNYVQSRGYAVHYWSIGNEPTLYADEKNIYPDGYDTVRFNQEWRAIATAMKAFDPTIALLGPELHQFTADPNANPKDASGRDWMTEFLRANGDLVDVVAIHRYPFPRNEKNATIADLRANSAEWDRTIPYLRELIHTETGRDLPIAVTEINSHYSQAISGEGTPDSHYNALWLADVLGRMIKNDVLMVNQWMLTSSGGQGGWGLITRSKVYPSYYTYQLYKRFGSERLYSSSADPLVTLYAAQHTPGALTLMIINLKSASVSIPLMFANFTPPASAETWLFDKDHPAEQVADTPLSAPLTLPAESVTLLIIPSP